MKKYIKLKFNYYTPNNKAMYNRYIKFIYRRLFDRDYKKDINTINSDSGGVNSFEDLYEYFIDSYQIKKYKDVFRIIIYGIFDFILSIIKSSYYYVNNIDVILATILSSLNYKYYWTSDYGYIRQYYKICKLPDKSTSTISTTHDKSTQKVLKCHNKGCESFLDCNHFCNSCKKYTCQKCYEPTKSLNKHECDENTLKTIQKIKNTSKQCPNCNMSINKSYGCNDMFCTNCHIFFCYRTGKKLNGVHHNPEYTQWKKKLSKTIDINDSKNINDSINCNDSPIDVVKYNIVRLLVKENTPITSYERIIYKISHYYHYVESEYYNERYSADKLSIVSNIFKILFDIGRISTFFTNKITNIDSSKLNIRRVRINHIENKKSVKKYKTYLHRIYKHNMELEECQYALDDFVMRTLDKLINLVKKLISEDDDHITVTKTYIIKSIQQIIDNINKSFIPISKLYNVKKYSIKLYDKIGKDGEYFYINKK